MQIAVAKIQFFGNHQLVQFAFDGIEIIVRNRLQPRAALGKQFVGPVEKAFQTLSRSPGLLVVIAVQKEKAGGTEVRHGEHLRPDLFGGE